MWLGTGKIATRMHMWLVFVFLFYPPQRTPPCLAEHHVTLPPIMPFEEDIHKCCLYAIVASVCQIITAHCGVHQVGVDPLNAIDPPRGGVSPVLCNSAQMLEAADARKAVGEAAINLDANSANIATLKPGVLQLLGMSGGNIVFACTSGTWYDQSKR